MVVHDGQLEGSDTPWNSPTKKQQKVREGTLALQEIAEEVEQEREQNGSTQFDPPAEPEERAMADAAAFSEDNPDASGKSREDHEPPVRAAMDRAETAVQGVLRPVSEEARRPH